ncbi:MAG: hypothetical protein PHS44_07800 [Candidatus Dojkabacteria bacterium]|nr:hypothetical protein [Candidatus Dojkabacteria bacterium]
MFWVLGEMAPNESSFITLRRFLYLSAELGTLMWFLGSFKIRENYYAPSHFSSLFQRIVTIFNLVLIILLVTTSLLVRYDAVYEVGRNGEVEWYDPVSGFYLCVIFINLTKLFSPILNFYFLARSDLLKNDNTGKNVFHKFSAVAVVLFLGGMTGMIWHFAGEGRWEIHTKVLIVSVSFILAGTVYGSWILLYYNTLLEQKEALHRNIFVELIRSLISAGILIGTIFWVFKTVEGQVFLLILIFIVLTFVVLNNGLGEILKQTILDSIRHRRITVSTITQNDLNILLKIYIDPTAAVESSVFNSSLVTKYARSRNLSNQESLRNIVNRAVQYFRPQDKGNKRTLSRLRYEILRQMVFEGATESQIMWNLGFDVYTRSVEEKLESQVEPPYKLRHAGEYSATSVRSFKRLKKESLEMLRWKLEEMLVSK